MNVPDKIHAEAVKQLGLKSCNQLDSEMIQEYLFDGEWSWLITFRMHLSTQWPGIGWVNPLKSKLQDLIVLIPVIADVFYYTKV